MMHEDFTFQSNGAYVVKKHKKDDFSEQTSLQSIRDRMKRKYVIPMPEELLNSDFTEAQISMSNFVYPDDGETLSPVELSDDERMTEFSYTGNPDYLTPALGMSMGLSREMLSRIPGITEAELEQTEPEETLHDFHERCLQKYGLDDISLEGFSPSAVIQKIFDVARLPVETLDGDERDDRRYDIEIAIKKLADLFIEKENYVYEAFHAVRLESSLGIIDVETLHEAYRLLYWGFLNASHNPDISDEDERRGANSAQALNEFAAVVQNFFSLTQADGGESVEIHRTQFAPETNYLTAKYFENFLYKIGITEDAHHDEDNLVPFEITEGRAAVFSLDNLRVFISHIEDSDRILSLTKKFLPDVAYAEAGQYFARHARIYIPEEISDAVDDTINAGAALRSGGEFGTFDEKDLVEYVSLLRSDARNVIEEELNLTLSILSVIEQLNFLNYLKRTSLADIDHLKNFTATYGVTGMRTFLALERGAEDLGDKIVEFGQQEELAQKVFGYYCELLDIAERAEELVKDKTDCEGEKCLEGINNLRENILNRAQIDLEKAVRADDIRNIEALLSTYVAEAKKEVAFLQEFGLDNTESIRAAELAEGDKRQMLALLDQNYHAAYGGQENVNFRETIRTSLEESFANQSVEFRIVRHNEKIISFNRFDITTNNEGRIVSYFGSFNADPVYSGVGRVMLERTIQEQLEKCDVMYAHCDPTSDIAKKYIESGFVAKETKTVAGKFSFEIWRTKDIAEHLHSKQMSIDSLLEKVDQGEEGRVLVREVMSDDPFEELDPDLGYLLTRYFKNDGKTYAVFETPSPTLWNQFKT